MAIIKIKELENTVLIEIRESVKAKIEQLCGWNFDSGLQLIKGKLRLAPDNESTFAVRPPWQPWFAVTFLVVVFLFVQQFCNFVTNSNEKLAKTETLRE